MAELENLLLEAAGRTSSPRRNKHKGTQPRRQHEESHFGKEELDKGASNKKPYTSQSHVPLKKRLDSSKRFNDKKCHEGSDYDDRGSNHGGNSSEESDVGSDLYKDEDDRERLANMSELQREMILSDRAQKKGDKDFKEQLRSKRENARASQSRKDTQPPSLSSSSSVRSSTRFAERTAAKGDVLNELRAKRLKQQNLEIPGEVGNAARASPASRDLPTFKKKPSAKASLGGSSQSDSMSRSDSEDKDSTDDGALADSDDDRDMPDSATLTFEDIKEITIRRTKLVKWFMEPFFEELIVGCFVRIGFGRSDNRPVYRLCMVQSVDASDPQRTYKLENRSTHKYLYCTWGTDSSASRFQMAVVSDSPPLEAEFNHLLKVIDRTCSRMPSKEEVKEKWQAIQKTNSYIYSADTVKQMLREKKSAPSRPINVAVEKDRLRNQLEVAKSKHDEAAIDRINTKLKELEAYRQSRDNNAKAIRLAEMNRKNKIENFKMASELKKLNTNLKDEKQDRDPFSRRWTRSTNYFLADHSGKKETAVMNKGDTDASGDNTTAEGETVKTDVGTETNAAPLEVDAADAGKLIDTIVPTDNEIASSTLHNFDLPISLAAVKKFAGPGGLRHVFLSRKQKIEATAGGQIPEDDGRRHSLTLTISDYKRRRGLL